MLYILLCTQKSASTIDRIARYFFLSLFDSTCLPGNEHEIVVGKTIKI